MKLTSSNSESLMSSEGDLHWALAEEVEERQCQRLVG